MVSLSNILHPSIRIEHKMTRYNIKETEEKWRAHWDKKNSFLAHDDDSREKYYVLEMFPYPSGRIHVGHVRVYTLGDVVARYKKAKGFNVIHPMGWDAFGLPAENAAIENNRHPAEWTYENIAAMRTQLKAMGLSFDWSREIATCHPDYYRHEQKMFLDFLKKGIAYRTEAVVNWDPVENTVLANEQVVDGKGWRSGAPVERRKLNQWSLKITDYAEDLLEGLKTLDRWPDKVRTMQENWIGRSEGVEFSFKIEGDGLDDDAKLNVYTTRIDTLMGTSFSVLAPEHPYALKLAETDPEAQAFLEECSTLGTSEEAIERAEKKGYKTPYTVTHPFTQEKMPVYIGNFVIYSYGTGAVKSAPAHDERDFAFATKYGLPIRPVITGSDFKEGEPYPKKGTLVNSGKDFDGLSSDDAITKIIDKLEDMGIGKRRINYRLRDWGISRQRYWGCPIPIVYCDACGTVPVPESDLPVQLPEDVSFEKTGNPLFHHPTWKDVQCPSCGKDAQRETDTFDTFFESSWYFARYCDPRNEEQAFDPKKANDWLPVNQYIGGIEHAVLHLLYARFFTRALSDCGYLTAKEPFSGLYAQGMVNHATYQDTNGKWVFPKDVIKDEDGQHILASDRSPVTQGNVIKMSKSKKNVVDPQDILEIYGADAARLFILSDSPPERDLEWTENGVDGAWKYINKLYRIVNERQESLPAVDTDTPSNFSDKAQKLRQKTHQTIVHIAQDIDSFHMNKMVAHLRELSNAIDAFKGTSESDMWVVRDALETMTRCMNPMIPHLAEELWENLGHSTPLVETSWPVADESLLTSDTVDLGVQINGKVKVTITLPLDADQKTAEDTTFNNDTIKKILADKTVRKFIYVPNRIVNVVVG